LIGKPSVRKFYASKHELLRQYEKEDGIESRLYNIF